MLQCDFFVGRNGLKKLVIFGVGLIGGSFALALKRRPQAPHIVGIGRSGESLQAALEQGAIDAIADSPAAALHDADVCLIAAPVAQTPDILRHITPHLAAHTIISDVGSTKMDVVQCARTLLGEKFRRFIPGHPIAGAEKSGVGAAHADLFVGRKVVLTPDADSDPAAKACVTGLWQQCGAHVTEMTAEHHDRIFAAVSHLPHLLAFALVHELALRPDAAELFGFAASGFRDFTRIAGSSAEMWRDISLANRTALLAEIDAYQQQLEQLRRLLAAGDGTALLALLQRASAARNAWQDQPSTSTPPPCTH